MDLNVHDILEVIRYYDYFHYPPTYDEVYLFLTRPQECTVFNRTITTMVRKGIIIERIFDEVRFVKGKEKKIKQLRYAFPHCKNLLDTFNTQHINAIRKLHCVQRYVRLLSIFPHIAMVGVSGTVSMYAAHQDDDIDIFIITRCNSLWVGRMIAICVAEFVGMRRRRMDTHVQDKVCLNLFFDKADLMIPAHKQSLYVAHELLQMKPVFSRNHTYDDLLRANAWVYDIVPHAQMKENTEDAHCGLFAVNSVWKWLNVLIVLSPLCAYIQQAMIAKHKGSREYVTKHQLWFFPQDNESQVMAHVKGRNLI